MTSPAAARQAFLVAAASVAVTCAVIACAGRRERSGEPTSAAGSEVATGAHHTTGAASSERPKARGELSARTATRVARRFATLFGRWDAGRRSAGLAARLRALCSRGLWRRLRALPQAPMSGRPSGAAEVDSTLLRSGDGRWRAAITTGPGRHVYLATAVVAPTSAGPRVTDLLP